MKRLILLPIFGMFIVLSVWGLSYAQMGGGGDHSKTNDSEQLSSCCGRSQMDKSGEMGMNDMNQMNGMNHMEMMKDMPNQCQEMSNRFESLGDNFQEMMKIDDMKELKLAMQEHRGMMQQMQNNMMEHGKMCQNMTTMMSGSDMTQSDMEVGSIDHAGHNH